MAELKYCPSCKQSQECTKKGFDKEGNQLYICKICGKRFIPITKVQTPITPKVKNSTKTATPKVEKTTKTKVPKIEKFTEIVVNNNSIKTVPEFISSDQAFDLINPYFKEILKENVTIQENDTKKTITFIIKSGTKG
jgi:transposase-like protein